MPSFADLGVTASRSFRTTSVTVGGVEASEQRRTRLSLQLPKTTPIIAGFCSEGLGRKLLKLFSSELQTGDSAFDDAVYISTDTQPATAKWLEDAGVRATILEIIEYGGSIDVEGDSVEADLPTHDDTDDPALVRLVESLLQLEG